jgi:sarcosine oxidase delta subunit
MNILDEFDVSKFKLGSLCARGHEYNDTKQSIRYISTGRCPECKKRHDAEFRKKQDKEKASSYNKDYREKNKEKLRQQHKEYWEQTRDSQLEKKKKRYEANKKQILERQKEYKDKNRDNINEKQRIRSATLPNDKKKARNAYHRKWYKDNIEAQRNRSARYRNSNPDKRAETCRNYRHSHRTIQNANNIERRKRLELLSDGSITPDFLSLIFKEAFHCPYCGVELIEFKLDGRWGDVKTLDHITPLSLGGGHTQSNVLVCCRQCNIKKGAKPFDEWIESLDDKQKAKASQLQTNRETMHHRTTQLNLFE